MSDPILASNPLEKALQVAQATADDLRDALVAEKENADRASRAFLTAQAERDAARMESERRGVLCDKAAAEIERLNEALAHESEKVRSLSASVEEMRKEHEWVSALNRALNESNERMLEERLAAVLREREECALAMERLRDRAKVVSPSAVRVLEEGLDIIRARSK